MNKPIFSHHHAPSSAIGASDSLVGELSFDTSLVITGKFSGKIISKGQLIIADTAEVEGEIIVDTIVIHGTARGLLRAKKRLEAAEAARIYAKIFTSSLTIADGALFEGTCDMFSEDGLLDSAAPSSSSGAIEKNSADRKPPPASSKTNESANVAKPGASRKITKAKFAPSALDDKSDKPSERGSADKDGSTDKGVSTKAFKQNKSPPSM